MVSPSQGTPFAIPYISQHLQRHLRSTPSCCLQFPSWGIAKAIFISWSIALLEYCMQVPGNRIAHTSQGGPFSAPQLKCIAEFVSLSSFAILSIVVLKEKIRWSDGVGFALIFAGVLVALLLKPKTENVDNITVSTPVVPPAMELAPSMKTLTPQQIASSP